MLDLKRIRNNPEDIKAGLLGRSKDFDTSVVDKVIELDERRRSILVEVENLKSRRNQVSAEIPKRKKAGENVEPIMAEMKKLGEDVKAFDVEVTEIDENIKNILLSIPNIPNANVPEGASAEENVEIRKWGEPTEFKFEPQAHWDLGVNLSLFDWERAGKITGSRFTVYKGLGAKLERAIINYFLETHTEESGYTEG